MSEGPVNTKPTSPPSAAASADLTAVLGDVLGNLAFMVGEEVPADLSAGTVWLQGELRYRGPVAGVLRCWCTRALAIQLAANLLGVEPEAGQAQLAAEDALGEFLNVLGGQLVTARYGSEPVIALSIPTVRECVDAPPLSGHAAGEMCRWFVGGEPLVCTHEGGL